MNLVKDPRRKIASIFGSKPPGSGFGTHHGQGGGQASAAQPPNEPETNIQPGADSKNSIAPQQRHGDALHNRGVDGQIRDEVAMGTEASQQQPNSSSAPPSCATKNDDVGAGRSSRKVKKGELDEKWLREKLSEVESQFQQEKNSWLDERKRLRGQIDHLNSENDSLKRELKAVGSLLVDAQNLSQVRGEELKGAQVFLTKADMISTTDVVQKVTTLNTEISQTASRFVELLHLTKNPNKAWQRQPTTMEKRMLGEKLASDLHELSNRHSLASGRTEPNPLLIQVVFQIAITTWCSSMVSSWELNDRQLADSMASMYSGIREFEDQAVSGRWRSITRAQLRRSSPNDVGGLQSFVNAIKGILDVAGWSIRDADQEQLERVLSPLSKAVQSLRKALGEDVTSLDMEVTTIDAGQMFDAEHMEDGFGGSGKSSSPSRLKIASAPENVVGTTGLGLRTRKGQTNENESILLPQVALEGVLKEAMKPVSLKLQKRTATRP